MTGFDPETDLKIERLIRATPESIWRCWSEPELFKQWFVPPPVKVLQVENDLSPGGIAHVVMKLPDGTEMPSTGCFLVADRPRHLVYTDALGPGFRPKTEGFMTVLVDLEPRDGGTLYSATVLHPTEADRLRHEEMGFFDGWGTTLDQLDRLAYSL